LRGREVKRFAAAMLAFSACLATAVHAQTAPYPPITIPLKIDQVPGKPIYYSTGNPGIPGIPGKDNEGNTSNAGFVVTSDGVVVFDALGTPSLGWALLQDIRKVTDTKIRYVIASHYHADHIYGLQAFKDHTDAVIVAQERAGEYKDNEETADEKASQRLDQRRGALFPWVDNNTRVVAPDITFRDRMTTAATPTGFIWNWSNRSSKLISSSRHSGARANGSGLWPAR
jgi:glyoxylase-like metal-dependent hydrolase (beta-lactamase superfamily II)